MEPISNNQPSLVPKELSSLGSRAFASFSGEMEHLIDMTKNEKLPVANLGTKIDTKA